jgi:hypothetical protein
MRERDEARALISALQQSGAVAASNTSVSQDMEVSDAVGAESSSSKTGLDAEIIGKINDKNKELSSSRKGRKISESLSSREAVSNISTDASSTPHKSDKPGLDSFILLKGHP